MEERLLFILLNLFFIEPGCARIDGGRRYYVCYIHTRACARTSKNIFSVDMLDYTHTASREY